MAAQLSIDFEPNKLRYLQIDIAKAYKLLAAKDNELNQLKRSNRTTKGWVTRKSK